MNFKSLVIKRIKEILFSMNCRFFVIFVVILKKRQRQNVVVGRQLLSNIFSFCNAIYLIVIICFIFNSFLTISSEFVKRQFDKKFQLFDYKLQSIKNFWRKNYNKVKFIEKYDLMKYFWPKVSFISKNYNFLQIVLFFKNIL